MTEYHVGSTDGWSEVFFFTTFPNGSDWSPRFVIFGDLGNINGKTLGRLQNEAQQGDHDLVMHLGDYAYELWYVQFVMTCKKYFIDKFS